MSALLLHMTCTCTWLAHEPISCNKPSVVCDLKSLSYIDQFWVLATHFRRGLMSVLVICKFRKVWSYITPNVLTETRCRYMKSLSFIAIMPHVKSLSSIVIVSYVT